MFTLHDVNRQRKPGSPEEVSWTFYSSFFGLHLCVSVVHLIGLDGLAAGLAAVVDHHVELGPGAELPLPVGDGGERSDDQEWPFDALQVDLVEERDGLDGLSKTHLVSQDTVSPVGGATDEC